VVSRNGSGGD